jgi:hypothetical protein
LPSKDWSTVEPVEPTQIVSRSPRPQLSSLGVMYRTWMADSDFSVPV